MDLALCFDDFYLFLARICVIQFLGVFWWDEIIILANDEESWNKGFFHIF